MHTLGQSLRVTATVTLPRTGRRSSTELYVTFSWIDGPLKSLLSI